MRSEFQTGPWGWGGEVLKEEADESQRASLATGRRGSGEDADVMLSDSRPRLCDSVNRG